MLDSDSAALDAQLLLARVLGQNRSWLYAHGEAQPDTVQIRDFRMLVGRRAEGEPLAYLTGYREFWKQELLVGPEVLIPRPETELLVELALQLELAEDVQAADLGTGSGAIALALAMERPGWELFATDKSPRALALARANAERFLLENICFCTGEWCAALPALKFDLIVSNPPYVAVDDPHLRQGDLRFEPSTALVSAEEGLADLRIIAGQARAHFKQQGWLLLEHGWEQGRAVRKLLEQFGYASISTHHDHNGNERVTMGAWHAG